MSKGSQSATPTARMAAEILDPRGLIDACEEGVRMHFRLLMLGIAMAGYGRCTVVCSRRTLVTQCRLFGEGRTEEECRAAGVHPSYAAPTKVKCTWCKPEDSKHVRGIAIDVSWGIYRDVTWRTIGRIADVCGVTWGGEWEVKDYGHFEV